LNAAAPQAARKGVSTSAAGHAAIEAVTDGSYAGVVSVDPVRTRYQVASGYLVVG